MKPKMTICSALELIAQETKDSKFSKECMKSIAGAARFLKRKMDLTVMQCYVLSVVLEKTRENVSCQDLAEHASVSPLLISGGQIENVARRLMVDAILYGNKISGKEIVSACEEERFCKKTHK